MQLLALFSTCLLSNCQILFGKIGQPQRKDLQTLTIRDLLDLHPSKKKPSQGTLLGNPSLKRHTCDLRSRAFQLAFSSSLLNIDEGLTLH